MGAYGYASLIERLLNSCEFLEDRPGIQTKIFIPADNPYSFYWKEKFFFRDDNVLTVTDIRTFDSDGNVLEVSFGYDFKLKGTAEPHFRICNHTSKQSVNEPSHVHVGSEDNVIECFPDSKGKDFTYALHCIKNYHLGKAQDWENGADDVSLS